MEKEVKSIVEEFQFKFEPKVLTKFIECCKMEGIKPKEFAERIEAYLLNKKKEKLTIEDITIILKDKKRGLENKDSIIKKAKKTIEERKREEVEIKEIQVYDRIMNKENEVLKNKMIYFSKRLKSEFIGRLLCDSITGKEEFNEKSIIFEGINQDGNQIVYLLDNIKKEKLKELYSGQIVGINGEIENNKLKVKEMINGLPIQFEKEKIMNEFKVMIIYGKYKKEWIEKEDPSIIISIGETEIESRKIIQIPLLNESLFVYPQPKMNESLSNPSIINLNGLSFGLTSLDIFQIFNLNPDLFLKQRSFYPKHGLLFHKDIPYDPSISLDFIEKIPSIFIFPNQNSKDYYQYYNDILFIHPKLNSSIILNIDSKNNYSLNFIQ